MEFNKEELLNKIVNNINGFVKSNKIKYETLAEVWNGYADAIGNKYLELFDMREYNDFIAFQEGGFDKIAHDNGIILDLYNCRYFLVTDADTKPKVTALDRENLAKLITSNISYIIEAMLVHPEDFPKKFWEITIWPCLSLLDLNENQLLMSPETDFKY